MAWRDKIEVHEATNRFPMMAEAELQELASDIAENGLRVGLVLWTPELPDQVSMRKGPQKLYLLDGRNRLEAIERAYSSAEEVNEAIDEALDPQAGLSATAPAKIIFGDEDPLAYVISANIRRRHLTAGQKREIIAELLRNKPERTDRATAQIAGVRHETVAAVRSGLEANGEIRHKDDRREASGRAARGRRPTTSVRAETELRGAAAESRTGTAGPQQPAYKPPEPSAEAAERQQPPQEKSDLHPTVPERVTGKVLEFDKKKSEEAEAREIDQEVTALISAWDRARPKAKELFLGQIGISVFDRTNIGS